MRLRADICETFDGARIDPFYVIETADVVAIVAITTKRELVLVRQYRHGYGSVALEIPAGRVDDGEEPVAAGRRELGEETGFAGGTARLVRSWSPNTLRYANRLHVVVIEDVSVGQVIKDDPLERVETVLWPLEQAYDLLAHPDFANAALAGGLACGLAALGHAPPLG